MSDLIERQAAIDAVNVGNLHKGIVSALQEIIRDLPSAEPQIIRCGECANYDTSWLSRSKPDKHYCPIMDTFLPDVGYCCYAERKSNG